MGLIPALVARVAMVIAAFTLGKETKHEIRDYRKWHCQ